MGGMNYHHMIFVSAEEREKVNRNMKLYRHLIELGVENDIREFK
jgi:hypothetical protein